MVKIPEPKTIVFGEVPYSFNGVSLDFEGVSYQAGLYRRKL